MMSPHRDNGGRGERDAGQRHSELDSRVETVTRTFGWRVEADSSCLIEFSRSLLFRSFR